MLLVYDSYLQREVVAAADEASRLYKENTPIKKYAKGEWEEMAKATAAIVRSFKKNQSDKMLVVVHPPNGDDFMIDVCSYAKFSKIIVMYFIFIFVLIYEYFCMQINKHWTSNSKP